MLSQEDVERAADRVIGTHEGRQVMMVHPSGRTAWTISYTGLFPDS